MFTRRLVSDTALVVGGGYLATKTMERFNMATYPLESEADREREERVRPGPPFQLAAQNLAERILGIELDPQQASKAGMAFHQIGGLSWTPTYLWLRRVRGWRPVTAGLATGATWSVLLDEVITPAIGASAPNSAYPVSTHIRAFLAHLVYGLSLAAVVETGWRLLGDRPCQGSVERPWRVVHSR